MINKVHRLEMRCFAAIKTIMKKNQETDNSNYLEVILFDCIIVQAIFQNIGYVRKLF